MIRRIVSIIVAVAAIQIAATAQQFDIYLLIGQSNMAGRGIIEPADTAASIDGVWLLNDNGRPETARTPLNRYSTIRKELSLQGICPGEEFGRRMHARDGRQILLVVNARGGSHIAQWQPGAADGYFGEALTRVRQALPYGTLKAILWNQGETDVQRHTPDYVEQFGTMVRALRDSIGAGCVPVVMSQVGRWRWAPQADIAAFNDSVVPTAAQTVEKCGYIDSRGLERRFERKERDPHYSRTSQFEIGRRYAAALDSLRSSTGL